MTEPARILVTGADGFVGCAVTEALAERDFMVLPSGRREVPSHDLEGYRRLDVTDRGGWESLPACDVVVHCAAVFGAGVSSDEIAKVNIEGTRNAVEWSLLRGVKRFVLVSSGAVYGPGPGRRKETDKTAPTDEYSRSKREAEHLVASAPVESVIMRLYFPVGSGQSRGIVARLAARILEGEPVKANSGGGPTLTLTDIRDTARCLCSAAAGELEPGIYNVGGPVDYPVSTIARLLADAIGVRPVVQRDDSLSGDWCGDSTKVEARLGPLRDARDAIIACTQDILQRLRGQQS